MRWISCRILVITEMRKTPSLVVWSRSMKGNMKGKGLVQGLVSDKFGEDSGTLRVNSKDIQDPMVKESWDLKMKEE